MDYSRPELADRLAADYVAGTLRGPARRRLEALMPAHPHLRQAVLAWQERLAPLTASIEPQDPPPIVWSRIESRIGGAPARLAAPGPRWWQRLGLWQGLSGLALAAVVGLAVLVTEPPPAPIVVVLGPAAPGDVTQAAGALVPSSFVAGISPDGRAVVMRPVNTVDLRSDKALELWAVPAQGAPRSLGLVSAGGVTTVQRRKALEGAAALAVSLEPQGGSPSGAPTGPVLYVGKLGT